MPIETAASVFAAFCEARLWPGCGPALARRVVAAGVTHPDDVTPGALSQLDGVSAGRAEKLVDNLDRARPVFDVAEVLHAAGVPVRLAAAAVRRHGPGAASVLRDDPWRLLELPGVDVPDADAFAR
ncbi:MAG: hypothetical protein J2P24_03945, partial [Streptosporangiales bacterium]|nr:hypothetical protein [Streptosporangiales bacterium]MBO0890851.1 hypothetical protein [Acidothermales bacterium]